MYTRGYQMMAWGPNTASQQFMLGPGSASKYTDTYREMMFTWPFGPCL